MMESSIGIMPYMLQPGDYKVVAETVAKYLRNPGHYENPPVYTGPTANVAGSWNVTINYSRGVGLQQLELSQDGDALTGTQKGEVYSSQLKGKVVADHATLSGTMQVSGTEVPYTFTGVVADNSFTGDVKLGEYGTATFKAVRA
jgi:hypothetical protein